MTKNVGLAMSNSLSWAPLADKAGEAKRNYGSFNYKARMEA